MCPPPWTKPPPSHTWISPIATSLVSLLPPLLPAFLKSSLKSALRETCFQNRKYVAPQTLQCLLITLRVKAKVFTVVHRALHDEHTLLLRLTIHAPQATCPHRHPQIHTYFPTRTCAKESPPGLMFITLRLQRILNLALPLSPLPGGSSPLPACLFPHFCCLTLTSPWAFLDHLFEEAIPTLHNADPVRCSQ